MFPQVDISKTLRRIPWFVDLTPAQIDRLASISSQTDLEPGQFLFKEGDREDVLYVILEGQIELELEVPGHGQAVFFTAESLDVIGWSSLTPVVRQRTASARAVKETALVSIQSKLLQQLCDEDHDLGYQIMRRTANLVASHLLTTRICLMEIIATPEKV
jgi:CRP/FNR family transcriptional regulator, cyclic AMP receptor protein